MKQGDLVTVDGKSGCVYKGNVPLSRNYEDPHYRTVMHWAAQYSRMRVMIATPHPNLTFAEGVSSIDGIGCYDMTTFFFLEPYIKKLLVTLLLSDNIDVKADCIGKIYPEIIREMEAVFRTTKRSPIK